MDWADYPDVYVEIELEPGVWTDLSAKNRSFSKTGGRSRRRDRPEAARSTIVLDGYDRTLEPENEAGPHFGSVRLMRRVRIQAQTFDDEAAEVFIMGSSLLGGPDVLAGGVPEPLPLFTHFVESYDVDWPLNGFDATVTITAVDAFKILALIPIPTHDSGIVYLPGALINLVLDSIGWPEAERAIDPGTVGVVDASSGASALEFLLDIAQSEGGLFFHAPDGKLTFFDKNHVSADVLTFATDEILFQDVDMGYDDSELWNDITVTSTGQADERVEDARSIGTLEHPRYYRRALSVSTGVVNQSDRVFLAQDILLASREPRQRANQLTHLRAQPKWLPIVQATYLDPVVVQVAPPGGGPLVDQRGRIEGITIASDTRQDWRVSWAMAPEVVTNLLTRAQSLPDAGGAIDWTEEQGFAALDRTSLPLGHFPYVGVTSWELTNNDAATQDISMVSSPATQIPVVPGDRYVVSAVVSIDFFSPSSSGVVELVWRDSGGTEVAASAGDAVALNPSLWVGVWSDDVAPVGAAFVGARVKFNAIAHIGKCFATLVMLTLDQ